MDERQQRPHRYGRSFHGLKQHPLYETWRNMIARCYRKSATRYKYYGARGIAVAEEWWSFPPFLAWAVEQGWQEGLTLDRRDNDGDYCPDNCRFVTLAENCQNRRSTKLKPANVVMIRASTKPSRALAKELGVGKSIILAIRAGQKWSNVSNKTNLSGEQ